MKKKIKSPFKIYQNFISPKICEAVIDDLIKYDLVLSDYTEHDNKIIKSSKLNEDTIINILTPHLNEICEYYDCEYSNIVDVAFEQLVINKASTPTCENSKYIRQKWVRCSSIDITCVIFLSDYNDSAGFDSDYESYGGKLEFPQHSFGFNPVRGTLITYPSGPHFINLNSKVEYGNLHQVKVHIKTKEPLLYDPKKFPGDYKRWLTKYR